MHVVPLPDGTRLADVETQPKTVIGILLILADAKVEGVRVPSDVLTMVRLRAMGANVSLEPGADTGN